MTKIKMSVPCGAGTGSNAPVELIRGVENMQVLYGVDNVNTNGADVSQLGVTQYVPFTQVGTSPVLAVRVQLNISSPENISELGQRLTRTYTKTIAVRNYRI